jgi:tetratricopeptide (TPR) repeat protein
MSNKTDKALFMFPPLTREYGGLYQELLRGAVSYQQLGGHLVQLCELAHTFRQYDKLREAGRMLANLPIKSYQAIGHYFLAVAANRKGNGDQDEAKRLFELALDAAPDAYKVKSILSLGALSFHKGDFDSALRFYREPIKAGKLSAASIHAIRAISHLKSIEGSHHHAIKDLEGILPLLKYAPPYVYFDTLNSYAVELGEVGRLHEARNVSRIVVASPFAPAYPEWRETAEDLRPVSRSFVAIGPSRYKRHNVLRMPVVEHSKDEQISYNEPASVFNLQQWKEKMGKGKKGKKGGGKVPEGLTERDIIFQIIHLYTSPTTTTAQRYELWDRAQEIMSRPAPAPDDDNSDGA